MVYHKQDGTVRHCPLSQHTQLLGIYLIRGTDRARIQRGKRCYIAAQRRASHWHALLNPLQFDAWGKKRFQNLFAQWSLFKIARVTLYIESRWEQTQKSSVLIDRLQITFYAIRQATRVLKLKKKESKIFFKIFWLLQKFKISRQLLFLLFCVSKRFPSFYLFLLFKLTIKFCNCILT